jgi:hypothetical protein
MIIEVFILYFFGSCCFIHLTIDSQKAKPALSFYKSIVLKLD